MPPNTATHRAADHNSTAPTVHMTNSVRAIFRTPVTTFVRPAASDPASISFCPSAIIVGNLPVIRTTPAVMVVLTTKSIGGSVTQA
jgi:hypothetical protein